MQPPTERHLEDVTAILLTFREVTRHLWNSAFAGHPEASHDFINVEHALFEALVLQRIDATRTWRPRSASDQHWSELRVFPELGPAGCRVMWAQAEVNSWHWREIQLHRAPSLAFIGFFDWREEGPLDYQYIRCRVLTCDEHPQTIGADVLLEPLAVHVSYLHNP